MNAQRRRQEDARRAQDEHPADDSSQGESKTFDVTLVRDRIACKREVEVIEPGYGYVRLSQFQEHTVETS